MSEAWAWLAGELGRAQGEHVSRWLLNDQMYLVVAALLLLGVFRPAERWTRRHAVSLGHDFLYGVLYSLLVFPLVAVYLLLLDGLVTQWAPWLRLDLVHHLPLPAQLLLAALVNDFLTFFAHYLRHRFRPLWHFHTIHHSQEALNPLTTKRTHLVEHLFSKGVIQWIPLAVLGSPVETWMLYYLFDAVWDYFVHSNVRVPFGPLKWILVSPQYHRIHHSRLPQHFDKNFGDRFVIWDLLFGTACMDDEEPPPTGVDGIDFPHETTLGPWASLNTYAQQWWYPFASIARDLRGDQANEPS